MFIFLNSTIVGIFYGHAHKDQVKVFVDESDRPYKVGYLPGSQTTHSYLNPGYKIYTIEGEFTGTQYVRKICKLLS